MGRCLYSLILVWLFLFISACSDPDGSVNMQADNGGYSFHLVFPEGDSDMEAAEEQRSSLAIDCAAIGVNTITVTVFNAANVQQATGTWSCSAHEGNLENITPGNGYWADCQGKDSSGTVRYRGQDIGINITAGEVTNGKAVEMKRVGDDTTPPTISSVSPLRDATEVSRSVDITVVFSEAMNATTITAATFALSQGTTAILGTMTYSGQIATFHPDSGLSFGTIYTATVKASVTDLSGNTMGSDYSWSFTTTVLDVTPPSISMVSPLQNATGVSTTVDITAVFSEAMNATTINTTSFALNQGATAIPGTVTYSGGTATFNPTANLSGNTTYVATVKASAADLSGNAMGSDYSWSFKTGVIPDTGQTTSYTDIFGEDSDYTINPQSYTKLDNNGNDLPDSSASWAMVRDNVTGLIWENKTDDGGIHDKDNTYTWQDAQDVFITQLNNDNYGGNSDWRLPTVMELSNLVHADNWIPSINKNYFLSTMSSGYWSSTASAINPGDAWRVAFYNGGVSDGVKSSNYYVRAVRGGLTNAQFLENGNGTVTDTESGLMWQQGEAGEMTWTAALTYCENLELAGHNDWRLPSRNELQSIVDYQTYNPTINTTIFPSAMSVAYWASTTAASDMDGAWGVDFSSGDGYVLSNLKSGNYYVRAVRGGQ